MSTDWVANYRNRGREIEQTGEHSYTFKERAAAREIDLTSLPGDIELTVELVAASRNDLTLRNATPGQRVRVKQPMTVVIATEKLGTLTVENSAREVAVRGPLDRLIAAGSGKLLLSDGNVGTVEVRSGAFAADNGTFDVVELAGKARLPEVVGLLRIASAGATATGGGRLSIGRLELKSGVEDNRIALTGGGNQPWQVTVDEVAGPVYLEPSNVSITVNSNNSPFTVDGTGTLVVPKNATLTDVTVHAGITTNLQSGGTIMRLTGVLRTSACQNATVTAAPRSSFRYGGVVQDRAGRRSDQLDNATLRGVEIPVTADGRRYLRELANTSMLDPHLDHLPAFNRNEWPRLFARRKRTKTDVERRSLGDAASFTQELAGLAEHKSGSGSIRTRASWAAYRARQLDSSSPWERWGLGLFRLVGYGQRPGPPAIAWLGASLLGVPLVAWARTDLGFALSISPAGVRSFFVLYIEMLLSPFVLVRLAAEPQPQDLSTFTGQVVLLARALAAIPFVFTAVAVARFLRADWPLRA